MELKRVEIPAGTIEYAEEGEGPPVVLLHGLLMNHRVWDPTLRLLPAGFRYLRPVLPLGAHRIPMSAGADLSLAGQVRIVADLLDAWDLRGVTLVHGDWGGGLFLTARGLDSRVARVVVLPCEAFDNFPPGLPGTMAALAARLPGGVRLAARALRIGRLRGLPLMMGQMAQQPLPAELVREWTEPVLRQAAVRRDVRAYARESFDSASLIADTDALALFTGDALVVWSPDNKVMPVEHGRRLAALFADASYVEITGAYVLSMLDRPTEVAEAMSSFLLRKRHPS